MSNLNDDLNATIAAAVQARTEAEVLAALSNEGTFSAMVTAALTETVRVDYGKAQPMLSVLLRKTITEKTREVIADEIEALAPQIRAEVKSALKKSIGVISDSLVDGFVANATGRYPSIKVEFSGNE